MSRVIKTFGIWQVTDEGMNSTEPYEYNMSPYEIFETRMEDGIEVWASPIHLTEKTWLTGENAHHLQEFNQAFAFAQQHFAARRPADRQNVSDSYTMQIQKQMIMS